MRPYRPHLDIKKKLVPQPQQRTVKPIPRTVESEGRQTKEEAKKQEPDLKKVVKTPPATNKACGDYELNALMTRMVAVELRDLMKKTFKNLLDNPADEDECRAVQALRDEAASDLKNVLGLNITKRLLNVYNPLHVRIKFNGKPEKEKLREFLKKYNFIGFTRKAVNIFAAQVRGIDDFDMLCTEEEVKCGNVKVSVSPEYKFTTCPPNLRTKYKEVDIEDIEIDIDKDEEKNKVENKNICGTSKNIKSPEKDNNSSRTPKLVTVKLEQVKEEKTAVQTLSAPSNVIKSNKVTNLATSVNKSTQNIPSKEIAKKLESPKEIKPETKVVTPSKSLTKIASPQKLTTVSATSKVTPGKTVTKMNPPKSVTQVSPFKSVTKVAPPASTTKYAAKVTPIKVRQKICSKFATPNKFADDEDDYDELDDHDILALMSEGIVLDECCGSDEE